MSIQLQTFTYNPKKGHDTIGVFATLDFDPNKYKTTEAAAKAFYEVLNAYAKEAGYGDKSVSLWNPTEAVERGYGRNWMVSWEDGPYQWGICTSAHVRSTASGWYTEPHYSFDLCFTE